MSFFKVYDPKFTGKYRDENGIITQSFYIITVHNDLPLETVQKHYSHSNLLVRVVDLDEVEFLEVNILQGDNYPSSVPILTHNLAGEVVSESDFVICNTVMNYIESEDFKSKGFDTKISNDDELNIFF